MDWSALSSELSAGRLQKQIETQADIAYTMIRVIARNRSLKQISENLVDYKLRLQQKQNTCTLHDTELGYY